jgi:hypothetical protein
MQDVDRVSDVETLPEPSGRTAVRANRDTFLIVPCSQHAGGMVWDSGGDRHFGKNLTIRTAEAQLAVRLAIDSIAFLVNRPMMPATQERQVRQRGRASLSPMTDVMALSESHVATGKPATAVSVM